MVPPSPPPVYTAVRSTEFMSREKLASVINPAMVIVATLKEYRDRQVRVVMHIMIAKAPILPRNKME